MDISDISEIFKNCITMYEQANAFFKEGYFEEALSMYDQVASDCSRMYEQASTLFKEGYFEEALSMPNQAASEDGQIYDDMILKLVDAAVAQRSKCQYRLLRF